jgi:hypothetical protein
MLAPFPNFSKLHIKDKKEYEKLVAELPKLSDLSFATLMIWWNLDGGLVAAVLNSNLVLSYNLPNDPQNSGLCLVGTNHIKESLDTITAYLQEKNLPIRLVHVPELVAEQIKAIEGYQIESERDYDEYIIPTTNFYPLEQARSDQRYKVRRFLKSVEGRKLEVRELNLSDAYVRQGVADSIIDWNERFASQNDPSSIEMNALNVSLSHAASLGVRNRGLYVDDILCGFVTFQVTSDNKYLIGNHMKVDRTYPRVVDYLEFIVAGVAYEKNVPFLNVEMDLGIPGLRMHKTELRPVDFLRKYSVTLQAR